jgi:hypothetical protein
MNRFTLLLAAALLLTAQCTRERFAQSSDQRDAMRVLLCWNRLLLELDRYTAGYRPPVSARMYAYLALAAWEASLPGLPDKQSRADRYPGLQLPAWDGEPGTFILPVALHAAYERSTRHFFPHRPVQVEAAYTNAQTTIGELLDDAEAGDDYRASRRFGEAVADAVYRWSATDTVGHQAFLYNFEPDYQPAVSGKGCWAPTEGALPLLPRWGGARTFVVPADSVPSEPPLPYSEDRGSPFFGQALEVFQLSQPMTEENRWIAEFWSDDFPGVTFCAASRWISITNQLIEQLKPGFAEALEIYLEVSLALNDASVKVWADKYRYNVERPDTYITRIVYPGWKPLHTSPSFPTYPSAHAAYGAAAVTIYAAHFGDELRFTDCSHHDRKEFLGKARHFQRLSDMAREDAFSRLPIGVHFRMDCEDGLRIGEIVGQAVLRESNLLHPHPAVGPVLGVPK